MFKFWDLQKEDVLGEIKDLEQSLGDKSFQKKYKSFFLRACSFLEIPDHIIKDIYKINDPYLKDSIIWKYLNNFGLNLVFRKYKCFEIDKESRKKTNDYKSLWVESLESFGEINQVPSKEIYISQSAYVFINNDPYFITLDDKNSLFGKEDGFYSEQKWADKETAILIALINLTVEYGWCDFFISDKRFSVPLGSYGFDLNDLKKDFKKIEKIIELYGFIHDKTNELNESKKNFSYKRSIDSKKIEKLDKKIDRKDSVLVRCLYYYAKACSFVSHRMMMEESTALQMFCLDGLSRLFLKKYKISKIKELSKFLQEEFNCPYGEYLEELHDERTVYVHPENVHGDYWCPPWDADTCYDTLPLVRDLLILYLTDSFKSSN
jgi:hypothetical protein